MTADLKIDFAIQYNDWRCSHDRTPIWARAHNPRIGDGSHDRAVAALDVRRCETQWFDESPMDSKRL